MARQLDIRQETEEREESLSPYAAKNKLSRGRLRPEEPCPIRTAYQRDRDRIIHCKAFRRLKHKTQVFIAPLGDHYVTRLTHTLEVLKEWNRVLKPGGKLWLSVPDFDAVVRMYLKNQMLEDWLIYHMYGEQGYEYQYHYIIFNWPNLRALLHEAGFSDAKKLESLPGNLEDASELRDTRYRMRVALNSEATK